MYKHSLRKAVTLFFVYFVFIIGIFVLQFRKDSGTQKNFGALSIFFENAKKNFDSNFEERENFKNLRISYEGIDFFAGSDFNAVLKFSDESEKTIFLKDWCEDAHGFKFEFSDEVSILCEVLQVPNTTSGASSDLRLSISAQIPKNAQSLSLCYKNSNGFSDSEKSPSQSIFSSHEKKFLLSAALIQDGRIFFTEQNSIAYFSPFVEESEFSFASILGTQKFSSEESFQKAIQSVKKFVVENWNPDKNLPPAILEKAAAAYVCEMALRKNYHFACNNLGDTIRLTKNRTFFSSPFLDSLVSMSPSLFAAIENQRKILEQTISQKNLSGFSNFGIWNFVFSEIRTKLVLDFLKIPSMLESENNFNPTILEAAGILELYSRLESAKNPLSKNLLACAEKCVQKFEHNSFLRDGEKLILTENGAPLSQKDAVTAGIALYRFGKIQKKSECVLAGKSIVTSAISDSGASAVFFELYEILFSNEGLFEIGIEGGDFFPHCVFLKNDEKKNIWMWTIAKSVHYDETESTSTLTVEFQAGESHYAIICGVEPFDKIEIYGISFRSDPHFENYNSSGYVYNAQTKTLFLKFTHKTQSETVKLFRTPKNSVQATQTQKINPPQNPPVQPVQNSKITTDENPSDPSEQSQNENLILQNSSEE